MISRARAPPPVLTCLARCVYRTAPRRPWHTLAIFPFSSQASCCFRSRGAKPDQAKSDSRSKVPAPLYTAAAKKTLCELENRTGFPPFPLSLPEGFFCSKRKRRRKPIPTTFSQEAQRA